MLKIAARRIILLAGLFSSCYLFLSIGFVVYNQQSVLSRRLRASEGINFQDKNLENCIREAIGKSEGPILESDLAKITELNAEGKGISNLEGIEYLVNLKVLKLDRNNITDISPLRSILERGLDEFTIVNNPITIGDGRKLTQWEAAGRGKRSIIALTQKLEDSGFKLTISPGSNLIYTNGVYTLTERNSYIRAVSVFGKMVLDDAGADLKISDLVLDPGQNRLVLIGERKVIILTSEGISKVLDRKNLSLRFFPKSSNFEILKDKSESDLGLLNQQISDFVLDKMKARMIIDISEPIPQPGESKSVKAYKFNVLTDKGVISIYVKKVPEIEGKRFQKASQLDVAPEGNYISSGFIVYKNFEGKKLRDILWDSQGLNDLVKDENYKWIFEQLGQKIARLENNDINYYDHIHFNTLVNFNTKEIRIIDYEIAAAINPVKQIEYLINDLNLDKGLKDEMLNIFESSYREAKGSP